MSFTLYLHNLQSPNLTPPQPSQAPQTERSWTRSSEAVQATLLHRSLFAVSAKTAAAFFSLKTIGDEVIEFAEMLRKET